MGSVGSMAIPSTHRAVIIEDGDAVRLREDQPLPPLADNQFLVRTEAVAVNPSDTKMRGPFVTSGGVLGTDYAGTVVACGPAVSDVAVGDRVCGAKHAMNANEPLHGSFGEFNVPTGRVWMKLPPSISTESGATFGAGISTAGLALKLLGLPLPGGEPVAKPGYVLVHGGSTATATIVLQLLRLIGMTPIATCSPRNSEQVKAYGAEETFDYNQEDCSAKIKAYTKNNLHYALDCITNNTTTPLCLAAMSRGGGKYVSLDPLGAVATAAAEKRPTVKRDWVLGPSIFGDGSTWPAPYGRPPSDEIRAFGVDLWTTAEKLVAEGKLRPHPVRTIPGGLEEGVQEGMGLIRDGKLSGEKCVVLL